MAPRLQVAAHTVIRSSVPSLAHQLVMGSLPGRTCGNLHNRGGLRTVAASCGEKTRPWSLRRQGREQKNMLEEGFLSRQQSLGSLATSRSGT